eukprot:2933422-Pleurochrysis_carterae.AAC.4
MLAQAMFTQSMAPLRESGLRECGLCPCMSYVHALSPCSLACSPRLLQLCVHDLLPPAPKQTRRHARLNDLRTT